MPLEQTPVTLADLFDNPHITWVKGEDGGATATLAASPNNRVYHHVPRLDEIREACQELEGVRFGTGKVGSANTITLSVSQDILDQHVAAERQQKILKNPEEDEFAVLCNKARGYLRQQAWRKNGGDYITTFTGNDARIIASVFERLASVYDGEFKPDINITDLPGTKIARISLPEEFLCSFSLGTPNRGVTPAEPIKPADEWWKGGVKGVGSGVVTAR